MSQKETYLPHYTYNDYVQWEGRWELMEGIPIAMCPMPTPDHQEVGLNLMIEFKASLKKSKCKNCKVFPPLDYKLSEDTLLQPDFILVCDKINKPFLDFTPVLVGEVLSPSTAIRDRNYKFNAYEKQGVKYYLIVDVKTKRIEINKLVNGNYETLVYEQPYEFELADGCKILADFTDVWK